VGSALVRLIERYSGTDALEAELEAFTRQLKGGFAGAR
jgi:tryptophan synthase alpha subunit